jgi:3-oxoacid CoA-transferase subunit A
MDKLVASAAEAVADVPSGASLAVGGFGLCGIPSVLIGALARTGAREFEVVSNNCGVDTWGLGLLLHQHRIRRVIATIAEVEHFFEAGELDPDEIHLLGVFVQRVVALTPCKPRASAWRNAPPGANGR